jgi:pheromone shutdown protein TraB
VLHHRVLQRESLLDLWDMAVLLIQAMVLYQETEPQHLAARLLACLQHYQVASLIIGAGHRQPLRVLLHLQQEKPATVAAAEQRQRQEWLTCSLSSLKSVLAMLRLSLSSLKSALAMLRLSLGSLKSALAMLRLSLGSLKSALAMLR